MLATFKMAYNEVSLPPRLPSQLLGILGVLIINLFQKIINKRKNKETLKRQKT
jgi:hypothetical protein